MKLATDTYGTTIGERQKIRVRYIPQDRLDDETSKWLDDFLSSFQHLCYLAYRSQQEMFNLMANNFILAVSTASTRYKAQTSVSNNLHLKTN